VNTQKIQSVHDFLSLLKGVKAVGKDQWLTLCPGHNDREQSLSVKEADDKILVKCFAGCATPDIVASLGLTMADLNLEEYKPPRAKGIGGSINSGEGCEPVNTPQKHAQKELTPLMLTGVNCVNLSTLAKAKHLPVDYLEGLGISDFKYNGQPAVKIPYYGEDGIEVAIRFRLSLSGDSRFKWRKGDHAMPYGLNRLDRKAGWVLIVEGESDCWTAWLHGIPALGAPGKGIWPPAWGDYLKGLEVYVWQEPGAEDFVLRVLKSVPGLRFIRAPDEVKDISEAHVQGASIPALLAELKAKAEYGEVLRLQYTNEQLQRLYHEAKAVIETDDPLELVKGAIRGLGYGGDIKPAVITYLAVTSRLLEMRPGTMPVHLLLTGPSSGGKSYTLGIIKELLPTEVYHIIDAGSPRVLIYDEAPLEHRALVFGEADSLPAGEDNPAASAVRNLLQDHHLHYEVTIRDRETGNYQTKRVHKPGPTVLITTSTRSLGDQLMTRFFSLEIGDSKEQISAALVTQAALEMEGIRCPDAGLVAFQSYLQLKAPVKVTVPYARELGMAMAKMAVAPRILRDFARLMSLIKALALLRHYRRGLDDEGHIMATLADYATVRELVNDMYIDSSTGATSDIRKLVEAVIALDASRADGERITNTTLAKHLDIGIMQATRRAKKALKQDWLINREQRKYRPADYAPGEPMPEVEGLPILEGVNTANIVNNEAVNAFSFKNKLVNTLTPLTDSDTPPHTPSDDIPDYPTAPCGCGCGDYWLTDWNQWLCSRCHPEPSQL